jgi:hypothetical protein
MDTYAPPDPLAHRFVWELLKTGLVLTDSLSSLIEMFEGEDPWPGRETGEVLIEAAAGSVAPALKRLPERDVDVATDLIVAVRDRFMGDLRLAAEISGRRENGHRVEDGHRVDCDPPTGAPAS